MSRVVILSVFAVGLIVGILAHRHGWIAAAGRALEAPAPWGNSVAASAAELRGPLLAAFPGTSSLVFLGDSNIELAPWDVLLGRPALNHGISGDTTDSVLGRLDAVLATEAKTVVLMIGINDLRRGDRVTDVADRYRRILHGLAKVKVVALAVLTGEARQKDRARILNAAIAAACLTGCRFLPLDELVTDGLLRSGFSPDGVHVTPEGYRVLARLSLEALPDGRPR